MSQIKILWADDEIEMLKPQLFFLEKKGYAVETVANGHDAIDTFREQNDIDVVFLDESMPGISGLETLTQIKSINANVPVVMITKNEAENLMEEAIGSQIDDYLIKPVNPNQILLTLKKLIDNDRLVSAKTMTDYQQEFQKISMTISGGLDHREWVDAYINIINWEIKLDSSNAENMKDILNMQKEEANAEFSKFVIKNYESWINGTNGPVMSHNLLKEYLFDELDDKAPNFLIVLDNLRYDQWKILEPVIVQEFRVESEKSFYSILPTATQYSRNSIFAGMLPADIEKHYPEYWRNDNEEGGKNQFESELMKKQLSRVFRHSVKFEYMKVYNTHGAKIMNDNVNNYFNNELTVIVYNFIDMLSHARTEMEVLKELAANETAYRSLTLSWFKNSPLWSALQQIAEKGGKVFITTDHGTIRVQNPSKVVGDKETTANLRYKLGRMLKYNRNDVFEIRKPKEIGLPSPNVSSAFIFAKEDKYFLYPNNYNYYNNLYRDTFQHGGISLEEMICPFICLSVR